MVVFHVFSSYPVYLRLLFDVLHVVSLRFLLNAGGGACIDGEGRKKDGEGSERGDYDVDLPSLCFSFLFIGLEL